MNTGVGNAEIGLRTKDCIEGEWLADDRVKTGISRRVWLWPETREALAEHHKTREEQPGQEQMLFLNSYGDAWAPPTHGHCPVTYAFTSLLKKLDLHRPYYSLGVFRSMLQTISDEMEMPTSSRTMMGHVDSSISGAYRQRVSDERLREVSEHVRRWYFPDAGGVAPTG